MAGVAVSYEVLAKGLRCEPRHAQRLIRDLVEMGVLLRFGSGGRGKPSRFLPSSYPYEWGDDDYRTGWENLAPEIDFGRIRVIFDIICML